MVLRVVQSAGVLGIHAYSLEVEVDVIHSAMPSWHTVGLPESEVRESKQRVFSAIHNCGYELELNRITVNLAPADIRKEGTALDLPIAIGLLACSGLINEDFKDYFLLGELSLNGELRPVKGVLPIAILAKKQGLNGLILPLANAKEASVVKGLKIFGVTNLNEVVEFLSHRIDLIPYPAQEIRLHQTIENDLDFSDVKGQLKAKRALEVAASGGHNLLFNGPPGSGKTLLSMRFPSILPPLSFDEIIEVNQVYSVSNENLIHKGLKVKRPFRSPHHSISDAGLIGGGSYPRPGEVSMAHKGILFLDEIGEFKKHVLELLRQPLESKEVHLTRANISLNFPADFILLLSMNPCPCGYKTHPKIDCHCLPNQILRYRQKLSGPLLDRIDLQIEVPPVDFDDLNQKNIEIETSQQIQKRVLKTRIIQQKRLSPLGKKLNSEMTSKMMTEFCALNHEGEILMKNIMEKFQLSARSYDRILKVSRTIADMEESKRIETSHLLEAVQYRSLDRQMN